MYWDLSPLIDKDFSFDREHMFKFQVNIFGDNRGIF